MPQHNLEKVLLSRIQPRDPKQWGTKTEGDPEQALTADDYANDLLQRISTHIPVTLENFPPSPENIDLSAKLHMTPRSGITQKLFDLLRGNKDIQANVPSEYSRQYFDIPKDK